eukprot:scaffold30518_cov44-Cyclotella_meneghiniana.AAC.2
MVPPTAAPPTMMVPHIYTAATAVHTLDQSVTLLPIASDGPLTRTGATSDIGQALANKVRKTRAGKAIYGIRHHTMTLE